MKILSVADILAAQDITTEEVPVPGWGGAVVVRSISHRTMQNIKKKIEHDFDGDTPEGELEKRIWLEGVIDPSFSEEEYEMLLDKSSRNVMKVLNAIMKDSKATEEEQKKSEKSFHGGPDEVLPIPTSGEEEHDGSRIADRSETSA